VLPIIREAQKAGARAVRKLADALNAGGIATAREGGSDGKRAIDPRASRSDSSKPRNGEEATAIRFAGRNREREASNGWRWAWLTGLDWLIGYGYYPIRAIGWAIVTLPRLLSSCAESLAVAILHSWSNGPRREALSERSALARLR
jgi:hypothetical protein